jgi:hypothetical protein
MKRPNDDDVYRELLGEPATIEPIEISGSAAPAGEISDLDLLDPANGPQPEATAIDSPESEVDALIADETAKMEAEGATEAAKAAARARITEVIAARGKGPASAEPGMYESAFRKAHGDRPSNLHKWLGAIGAGISGGTTDAGRAQRGYDDNLASALMRDAEQADKHGYVDQATAELLHQYLGIDPEVAANMRKDSQAVGMLNNLGSMQLREREFEERDKDRDLTREMMGRKWEDEFGLRRDIAAQTSADRRYSVDHRKKSGSGGGAGLGGDAKAELENAIDQTVAIKASGVGGKPFTAEMATALRTGTLDESTVDPQALQIAKQSLAAAQLAARRDPKKLVGEMLGTSRAEATNQDAPGKSASVQGTNVDDRVKEETWMKSQHQSLNEAISAWGSLTPTEKALIVNLPDSMSGNNFGGMIRNTALAGNPKAQNAVAALAALQNVIIKDRSGASVSNQEMQRIYNETGQGFGKSPKTLTRWLNKLSSAYAGRVETLRKYYKGIGE